MTTPTPPNHQSEFVDNSGGNTLDVALVARLEWLATHMVNATDVAIASGYFNPEGFGRIANALAKVGKIRLLLGAEPVTPPARPVRHLKAPRGMRDERALRHVFTKETAAGVEKTKAIGAFVRERGFQPYKAPEPLPPIDDEDIRLIVWMAVEAEG